MYRCRRIFALFGAVVLSLAVVSSCFFAYADTDDDSSPFVLYFQWIKADGTTSGTGARPIQEGFLLTQGYIGIRIIGFGYKPIALNCVNSVSLSVRFSGYSSNPDVPVFQINVPDSSVVHNVTSWSTNFVEAPTVTSYGTGRGATIDTDSFYPASKTCTFQIQFRSKAKSERSYLRFNLETPYDLKAYTTGYYWWPYLDSVWFEVQNQNQIDFYPAALQNLNVISNFISSLANRLLGQIYSWNQVKYNHVTEEFELVEATGNWYDALLGSVQSLNADAEAQAAQQEKANNAGAGDALDNAYDSVGSSFGSLGDLSGLGSLGSFDGDALGNAGSGGLLSWFSQDTLNSIDAVPRSRAPDNIIDFYSGKIQSYIEEVSSDDDTTAD